MKLKNVMAAIIWIITAITASIILAIAGLFIFFSQLESDPGMILPPAIIPGLFLFFFIIILPVLLLAVFIGPKMYSKEKTKWALMHTMKNFTGHLELDINKIDPNVTNESGDTALHWAAIRNDLYSTTTLLHHKADPNCKGPNGFTPLHEAIQQQNTQIVKILLENGANPLIKCDEGSTKDLVKRYGNTEIKWLLATHAQQGG